PVSAMDREALISSLARWRTEHGVPDPRPYLRNHHFMLDIVRRDVNLLQPPRVGGPQGCGEHGKRHSIINSGTGASDPPSFGILAHKGVPNEYRAGNSRCGSGAYPGQTARDS